MAHLQVIADNSRSLDINPDVAQLFKSQEHENFSNTLLKHVIQRDPGCIDLHGEMVREAITADAEEFLFTLSRIAGKDLGIMADDLAQNFINSL